MNLLLRRRALLKSISVSQTRNVRAVSENNQVPVSGSYSPNEDQQTEE